MNRIFMDGVDITDRISAQPAPKAANSKLITAEVYLPPGWSLEVEVGGFSKFEAYGQFGDIDVELRSGKVEVDGEFLSAEMRTLAAPIHLEDVPSGAQVKVASMAGDVTARSVHGQGSLNSAYGDVVVDYANPDGPLHLRSSSGHVSYGVESSEATAIDHITTYSEGGLVYRRQPQTAPTHKAPTTITDKNATSTRTGKALSTCC